MPYDLAIAGLLFVGLALYCGLLQWSWKAALAVALFLGPYVALYNSNAAVLRMDTAHMPGFMASVLVGIAGAYLVGRSARWLWDRFTAVSPAAKDQVAAPVASAPKH